MSVLGHLLCPKCKVEFCLGKLIRDDENLGIGFGNVAFSEGQLGSKALHFLAMHLDHGLHVISIDAFSEKFDMNEYREADEELRDHAPY